MNNYRFQIKILKISLILTIYTCSGEHTPGIDQADKFIDENQEPQHHITAETQGNFQNPKQIALYYNSLRYTYNSKWDKWQFIRDYRFC